MITKVKLIELLQDRLSGAGTTSDIRKRYPYTVIEAIVSKVYSDSSSLDPESLQDMALEYTLTLTQTGTVFSSSLPVRPVGSWGLLWVSGNEQFIPTSQGGMQNKILGIVEPGRINGCRLVGDTIVYDRKPEEPLSVLMVPNFDDLSNNDNVIMMGNDTKIYEAVVRLIRMTDVRPEEVYNDGRDDSMKVQPKRENLERRA